MSRSALVSVTPRTEPCEGCGKAVASREPGAVLEDLTRGTSYHYHEACAQAALRTIDETDPNEWRLSMSHFGVGVKDTITRRRRRMFMTKDNWLLERSTIVGLGRVIEPGEESEWCPDLPNHKRLLCPVCSGTY